MATFAIQKPVAAGTISGNQPRVQVVAPAAAAVLNGGDLLVGSAANTLDTVALSASPAPATKTIAGFAIHGATQGTFWLLNDQITAGKPEGGFGGTFGGTFMGAANLLRSIEGIGVHVQLADPDSVFEVSLAASVGAFVLTLVGNLTGLTQDATTKFWQADTAQANKVATIVGFRGGPNLGVVGDTSIRVLIRFLNSVYILGL